MKYYIHIFLLLFCLQNFSQNVQVDSQTYTAQQLIENILIGNNCIGNVVVTNVSGGNFNGSDQSYGYFYTSGSSFPFQDGIVLSTGRLSNVGGPNNSLSDDNAPNWQGDTDLETVLNETNTINATILEFNFTSVASQVSFRYIFASEEYQVNNPNTCRYSDLFGFLIRNINDTQYTNIALIPNTQTPVKVTTVHPAIPNGCPAQNEAYFGSWNNATAPINFNGQTAILTATANIVPNETYHVKLVIADEQNYRYDSAVFLESGSFKLTTNLGTDRLTSSNNALCTNETLQLDATQPGINTYKWFKGGNEIFGETSETYTVTDAGTYNVEVTLQNTCISYGEITIEYNLEPIVNNTTLVSCDDDQDGLSTYNLFDAEQVITNADNSLTVANFFLNITDAQQNTNAILNPIAFNNTAPQQIIFARIENNLGCVATAEITLDISNNSVTIPPFEICDDDTGDGVTTFNIKDLKTFIQPNIPANAGISIYKNLNDAYSETNALTGNYNNTNPYSEALYVKIKNGIDCYALTSLNLVVLEKPELLADESKTYCLNSYPNTISLQSGLINTSGTAPTFQWYLNNTSISANTSTIQTNKVGTYTVVVTFSNTCSTSRTIKVEPSNTATIESIDIAQASGNNTVSITVSGEGNYKFALDAPIFQDENTFYNVASGFHTVFVYDINGCGTVSRKISVIGFPKFFTPNNDGFNDTWKPLGVNAQFNADMDIKIFNRLGKFIKQINPLQAGWDGTFTGQPMPADDYWYVVILQDGTTHKGHFTLKR